MAFVFKMVDEHKCDGCARKIKKCVEKLEGVESVEVKKTKDSYGHYEFTIVVKGSFDPQHIIFGVEIMKKKKIELVYDDNNNGKLKEVKPVETNVEFLEHLKTLASKNLGKAQKLTELTNECDTLKDQLHNAWARRNALMKQKLDIFNRDLPYPTVQIRSQPHGVAKKKDESELLYGKLENKKIKLEDFVEKYKKLQLKKHSRINPLA